MRMRSLIVACSLFGSCPSALCQQATATFRAAVELVQVPVAVVGHNGRFLPGLRERDFEVREDGKLQTIATFSVVDRPTDDVGAETGSHAGAASDVSTNTNPPDGGLYVLLIDDLHIAAVHTAPLRALAKQFVETALGPRDLAAVLCTSGRPAASQDFTSDRRLLAAAIEQVMGRGEDEGADEHLQVEERYNTNTVLTSIRSISTALAAVAGRRKALVLFSEGFRLDDAAADSARSAGRERGDRNPGRAGGMDAAAMDAIDTAVRANVTIYSVDPAGLKLAGGRADIAGSIDSSKPQFGQGLQYLDAIGSNRLDVLRELSAETGGFAATNTNNLSETLGRIRDDQSHYYLLGYYPVPDSRDDRFHRIDVKVGVSGVEVRARAGYIASRAVAPRALTGEKTGAGAKTTSEALQAVLDQPLPASGMHLTAFAAPFRGRGREGAVTIVVHVDRKSLNFSSSGGPAVGQLRLVVLATDPAGKTRNSLVRTLDMPLSAWSHDAMAAYGLRIVDRLELPHGRYRLRIGVENVTTRQVGSVFYDLEVPDYLARPVSMSGLVLTSSLAGLEPCVPSESLDALRPFLPGPPTVVRVFQPGEVLGVFAEVYDRHARPRVVDVTASVTDSGGREVRVLQSQWPNDVAQRNDDTYAWSTMLPLAGLQPGSYVLHVKAQSRVHPEDATSREVPFEIQSKGDSPVR